MSTHHLLRIYYLQTSPKSVSQSPLKPHFFLHSHSIVPMCECDNNKKRGGRVLASCFCFANERDVTPHQGKRGERATAFHPSPSC